MRIAIVEDERLAYEELKRMLLKIDSSIEIVNHFKSIQEISENLNPSIIDILFCDINLPDGDSISYLRSLKLEIPIVFITAYDDYAIEAFKLNSIDYLLKPFSENELRSAIYKYKSRINSVKLSYDNLRDLFNVPVSQIVRTRFLVKSKDRYSYIETNNIAYFYLDEKVSFAKTFKGERFIIDESLNKIEQSLDKSFFRVSRHMICSINSIVSANKYFNSRLRLKLNPEFESDVLISRVRVEAFLRWLNS